MFGRKKEIIENLESLTDKLCSEVDFLKLKLSRRNENIAELEQTIKHQKKALQSKPSADVLDKIRAEIERLHYHPKLDFIKNDEVVEMALDIIDKYRAKTEV